MSQIIYRGLREFYWHQIRQGAPAWLAKLGPYLAHEPPEYTAHTHSCMCVAHLNEGVTGLCLSPWCTEHSMQALLICLSLLSCQQKFYLFSNFTTILSEILLIFTKIVNFVKILAESYSGCNSLHSEDLQANL